MCVWRNHSPIETYREGKRAERGEATLEEAALALRVIEATVRRMIADKTLQARQLCKGAPWIILVTAIKREDVRRVPDMRIPG